MITAKLRLTGREHTTKNRFVKKAGDQIGRQMTTPLFLLRCVQPGISIRDLGLLTVGLVNDMYILLKYQTMLQALAVEAETG